MLIDTEEKLDDEPVDSLQPETNSNLNCNTQAISKIEQKRKKGRIRSKETRERRKAYVQKLEEKAKKLESENFRLQNLLVNYRNENILKVDDESRSLIRTMEDNRK